MANTEMTNAVLSDQELETLEDMKRRFPDQTRRLRRR